MKQTKERSFFYWQNKAHQFSYLYDTSSIAISLTSFTAKFLHDRTALLLSLMPKRTWNHMLDLGCGSGPHMKLFLPYAHHITGVDYSKQMLDLAKNLLKKQPLAHWSLIYADAAHLPFSNHSFDIIIAMGLLDYVMSPHAVLKECRRVITSNGILICTIPKRPSLFSILRTPIGNWVKHTLFHLPPIDNAMSKKDLTTMMRASGFEITAIKSLWNTMWMVQSYPMLTLHKKRT